MSLFAATLARTLGQAAAHGVGGLASLTPAGASAPRPAHPRQSRGGPPPCTPCAAAQMVRDASKKYGVR